MVALFSRHLEYWSRTWMRETYTDLGLEVFPDPRERRLLARIVAALRDRAPLSVIRLGDGEMNLLSFGAYPGLEALDRYCAAASVERRESRFLPNESWLMALREMMLAAVLQADIVGVAGLWRMQPDQIFDGPIELHAKEFRETLTSDVRGQTGAWRGRDYMLRLARLGLLRGKTLAPAHLYLGMLHWMDELLAEGFPVVLITSRGAVQAAMAARYTRCDVRQILLAGPDQSGAPLADSPEFLFALERQLPQDLSGQLCLVGAGPWAEIYCGWIRQRGGVGVDIGSAFDLLGGIVTRPIHTKLGFDLVNPYAL